MKPLREPCSIRGLYAGREVAFYETGASSASERGGRFALIAESPEDEEEFGISASGTLVTGAVREQDTGISNSFNSVLRRVGGGIGGQVGAALLASFAVADGIPREGAFVVAFAISAVFIPQEGRAAGP